MLKNLVFTIFLGLFAFCVQAEEQNIPSATKENVELYFFWSHHCPRCVVAKQFVEDLAHRYSWLTLHSYDLLEDKGSVTRYNQENLKRYLEMSAQLDTLPNAVPAFIFCQQIQLGFYSPESTGKKLEQRLLACYQQVQDESPAAFELPLLGKINYRDFSLPVFTLIIAALDAFNPCAFFVLFFLLSVIVHTRERIRIAIVGGTFVFFSGLMYFIFMAAWLNLFLLTEELTIITAIAGLVALLVGAINLKDYFFFKQGVSLSIPDGAKPKLFQKIRLITQSAKWPAMLVATMILAIVANSYELLCTAGLPMVYTRVLTLYDLSTMQYYLYLGFYNLIYIMPLLIVVGIFTVTLGSKKLSEKEGRILKLLSGTMMLGLGGLLVFAPNLLNNVFASIAVIGIAIVITVLFALIERKVHE